MFFTSGPITTSVIFLVIVLQIMLFRSRWGLRTRAVGEHPRAADTVGIDVIRVRYRNVILGGIFAGLAGAWLTLEFNASFQNGMTANRGFIALAAVIFGRWTPIGAFGGALLFMVWEALGIAIRSNPPPGDLGVFLSGIQASYPSLYNNFFGVAALPVDARSCWPASSGAASRRPLSDARTSRRGRADGGRSRRREHATSWTCTRDAARSPCSTTRASKASCARRDGSRSSAPRRTRDGRRSRVFRYLVHQGFDCVPVNPNERAVMGVPSFRDTGGGQRRDRPVRHRRRLPPLRAVRAPRARGRGEPRRVSLAAARCRELGGRADRGGGGPDRRHGSLHRDRMAADRRPGLGRRRSRSRRDVRTESSAKATSTLVAWIRSSCAVVSPPSATSCRSSSDEPGADRDRVVVAQDHRAAGGEEGVQRVVRAGTGRHPCTRWRWGRPRT